MIYLLSFLLSFLSVQVALADFEYSAEIGTRFKAFDDDGRDNTKDYQLDLKTKFQSDYETDAYRIHFGFFSRIDQNDSSRNIINFDEFYIKKEWDSLSVNVGNNIFNWSVLEIFHPIDNINSKNFDSNGDLTERLGLTSLIVRYEFESSFLEGILFLQNQPSLYPQRDNRNGPLIEFERPKYVNGDRDVSNSPDMIEYVLRYQHSFDNFDLDIHYAWKYDTNNPLISSPKTNNNSPTLEELEITPYFLKVEQFGLTGQFNFDAYLVKLEGAYFNYQDDSVDLFIPPNFLVQNTQQDFYLVAFGLERSFTYANDMEGTIFYEYQTVLGTTIEEARVLSPFQRDFAIGYRHNFNDFKGNEIIALLISDLDHGEERIYSISHSQRVSDSWKLESGIRIIEALNPKEGLELSNFEGLRTIANGDSFNIELTRFF